jgi:histidinol-phosphate/aromatic aminotransferase/cobyric acid decarboxylase-like protein
VNSGAVADDALIMRLRNKLSTTYRLPSDSIRLLSRIDDTLQDIVSRINAPIVNFPPSSLLPAGGSWSREREEVQVARGVGRGASFDLSAIADLPGDGVAFIDSPSALLGSLLTATDAVRLARACQTLVIDERHAEFAGLSLLPLAIEFDNIVVLRSFDTWAGLYDRPVGWLVGSARARSALGFSEWRPESDAAAAALATLDDLGAVHATLNVVREERSRLYRFIRKLSFLEPLPSWGPFVTARISVACRENLISALAAKDIRVHAPAQPGLEQFIRISVASGPDMDRLRRALLDIAPAMVAG